MADVARLEADCKMADASLSEEVVESNFRLQEEEIGTLKLKAKRTTGSGKRESSAWQSMAVSIK